MIVKKCQGGCTGRRVSTGRQGFLSLEAAMGTALLMFTFVCIISLLLELWHMIGTELAANSVAQQASRISERTGAHRDYTVLNGRATARVEWDRDYVKVHMRDAGGNVIVRALPREVP